MVLVQKWPFFQFFFLGNISHENVFYFILEGKNAFLGYKNNSFKKSKNWLVPKLAIFPTFCFLGNIGRVNIFYDILIRQNAFLGYKNEQLKKSKNWHFSKGVNQWFWSKNGHFFETVFF